MTIVCNNDPAYNLYVVSANRTQANSPSDAQYETTIGSFFEKRKNY